MLNIEEDFYNFVACGVDTYSRGRGGEGVGSNQVVVRY